MFQHAEQEPQPRPVRASDQDREAVLQRLQAAFAEGRLADDEFDQRMRAALTSRTSAGLAPLLDDLPAAAGRPAAAAAPGGRAGRFAGAYKSSVRRGGRWLVPERFTSVVYKGSGLLDLRAAELTAPVTTVLAVAYKSRIDVLVPPGIRVEMEGFGVTKGWSADEAWGSQLPAGAPVVQIRGIAYKGTIETSTRPPGGPVLRGGQPGLVLGAEQVGPPGGAEQQRAAGSARLPGWPSVDPRGRMGVLARRAAPAPGGTAEYRDQPPICLRPRARFSRRRWDGSSIA